MGAAVVGLQQHRIDLAEEGRDAGDNLDAVLLHLGGVFRDAADARLDIGASLRGCGDDAAAGDMLAVGGVVEQLREGGGVGGVEADDADADRLL